MSDTVMTAFLKKRLPDFDENKRTGDGCLCVGF